MKVKEPTEQALNKSATENVNTKNVNLEKQDRSHALQGYGLEIISAIAVMALGMLSGYSPDGWYEVLSKPSFNPPNWVFAPVWTVLYILIGIVFARLMGDKPKDKTLIGLWVLQMIYNLAWSALFFYYKRVDLALYDIALLWLSIVAFMYLSKGRDDKISLMFLPYLAWVSFASILNFYIYTLNY